MQSSHYATRLAVSDDRVHGQQEERLFSGYYDHYIYLSLYIFWGEHLLCPRLRSANADAACGSVEELERIVAQIRARWPKTRLIIRGDSGFCRDDLMSWSGANDVEYVLGLAINNRLKQASGTAGVEIIDRPQRDT